MRSAQHFRPWIAGVGGIFIASVIFAGAQAPQPPAAGPSAGQPQPPGGRIGQPPPNAPGRRGGGMLDGAGAADKPIVDPVAADRGKVVWTAECATCHRADARGTPNGPNLVRSLVVLHDRYGTELAPFLKRGHKMQTGAPSASLTEAQVVDLAHFLRQRVTDSLRGSPLFKVRNVLTGDPKAGAAYFNGEGKCSTCHREGNLSLAGIGSRYEPVDLQQRFLFPASGRGGRGRAGGAPSTSAVTVTVTSPSGEAVSGVLVQLDDFDVSLRDGSGVYRTFKRTPALKVATTDPLAAHRALLDTITDKNMHDVVAYLETLK
jgi:mono/diheme cytochrome c family protein